jgi:hypothetical protein
MIGSIVAVLLVLYVAYVTDYLKQENTVEIAVSTIVAAILGWWSIIILLGLYAWHKYKTT